MEQGGASGKGLDEMRQAGAGLLRGIRPARTGMPHGGHGERARRGSLLKRARLLFPALLIFFLTACAADPLTQTNFRAREPFRSPDSFFGNGTSVALFAASNSERGFEYRELLGDFTEEALRSRRPELRVVPYWDTLSIINSGGLSADFARMLKEYYSTGILESTRLQKIGRLLGVSYIIYPKLVEFSQGQSNRLSVFGLSIFKTHESQIKLYMEIWNTETGRIAWVGSAEANMASEKLMARPIPFEEITKYAIETLVQRIP
ncbi:MAG: hypothetical protein QY316_12480 [Thermodesulfobacteriota bacterium]|nr:MAG: hypothetical protein QY316_12480 [Thermodesulfobacteriota bacterium]